MQNTLYYKIKLTSNDEAKRKEIIKHFPSLSDGTLLATVAIGEDGTKVATIKEPNIGEITNSGKNIGTEEDAIIQAFLMCAKTKISPSGIVGGAFPVESCEDFRALFSVEKIS